MRAAFVLVFSVATSFAGSPSQFQTERLFEGGTGGYQVYRIPGIIVTSKGTVLAYTEARKTGRSDWDTIDITMRRSVDHGKTFSPQWIVAHVTGPIQRNRVATERRQGDPGDITYNNPVAISGRDGVVHFLFCLEYMRAFYMRSTDDGKTFTAPIEITAAFDAFRPEYDWRVLATGPGHGIQLSNRRLLVPVWLSLGTGGNGHHPSVAATIFSDDNGQTWHRGAIALPSTPEFLDPNETTAVQLADGSVMLNIRTDSDRNRRTVTVSPNGASGWSAPRVQDDLPDPLCFGALMRFSTVARGGRNRLLYVGPDNLTRADGKSSPSKDRTNLTVRLSDDEGGTWPVKRTVEPGLSGYGDLSVLKDGTILCLYEKVINREGGSPRNDEMLARFTLGWLTGSKD